MQRIILIIFSVLITCSVYSQNRPVANDDYGECRLEEYVTINVTNNDTHPDGLYFRVFSAMESVSFTDSTITYFFDYDQFYSASDTLMFSYIIADEDGNTGFESTAKVYLKMVDNNYYDFLNINNVNAKIQASGLQFWSGPQLDNTSVYNQYIYEFPKGGGKHTIFNSSIWVGGLDESGGLRLAGERYRQLGLDYWPGPVSNNGNELSVDKSTAVQWQKVWKLTKEEIIFHKFNYYVEGYEPIESIATWPAHGDMDLNQAEYLAPFVDVDGDSIYDPMSGDYPLIRGDQCIYFIINDVRDHLETSGEILGLEIHGMAYEFSNPDILPIENSVFFSYKIINRSSNTYNDTYIGLLTDFDIGYGGDDYVGCDVARGAYYGYNADSIDGNGEPEAYGETIPAQGIVILGGPIMDSNGVDDPDDQCNESINGVGFGDGISDNERYGMNKFVYFNNSGGSYWSDPTIASEYYSYLNGLWRDGTPMEYGGNGHVSTGAYGPAANFMYPGLTDPCFWGTGGEEPYGPIEWTEKTAGNDSGDRRGLSVMGPFTFEPGSMERVDIAFVSAFPEGEMTDVETLMAYIDIVKDEYYQDPTYFGYQWLGVEDETFSTEINRIKAYPNPTDNMLSFSCENLADKGFYKLVSIMGEVVYSGSIDGNETINVDMTNLSPGIYIITITNKVNTYSTKVIKN